MKNLIMIPKALIIEYAMVWGNFVNKGSLAPYIQMWELLSQIYFLKINISSLRFSKMTSEQLVN